MRTKKIDYYDGDTPLEGYLVYNADIAKARPGVIVAHDWSGRNEFACQKAEKLAQLGYVGFAIDMFGKDVLGANNDEKSALIKPFFEDRSLVAKRMLCALETIKTLDVVDATRIGAIGFCFGGLCVLDLARTGAKLRGVVSFHGILQPPEHEQTKKINAKVLVLHGYEDPMVPPQQVANFEQEMTEVSADWQVHVYGNAMHSFTNPNAHDKDFGTVYDKLSDRRSWISMQNFFTEILL